MAGTLTGIVEFSGITVQASDVTIDLGGHALVGVPFSFAGIEVSGPRQHITLRNGTVRDWGGSRGVGGHRLKQQRLGSCVHRQRGWRVGGLWINNWV